MAKREKRNDDNNHRAHNTEKELEVDLTQYYFWQQDTQTQEENTTEHTKDT